MPTALSAIEIEVGKLAINRGFATRDQVRECAELRSSGQGSHIVKLLVDRGYVKEQTARNLYDEVQKSSGSRPGIGSGSRGGHSPDPAENATLALEPNGNGSHAGPAGTGFGSRLGQGNTQVVNPNYVQGPNGTYAQRGAAMDTWSSGFQPERSHRTPLPPGGSNFGAPGSNFGSPGLAPTAGFAPGSNYGAAGSNFGTPGSNYGAAGSNFAGGVAGSNFGGGVAGSNFGPAGSNFGGGVAGSNFGSPTPEQLPSNIAPDDPIAHVMGTRQNSDGSTETIFGPYDIVSEIARGGMGIVYRARQRSLKRIVALKVMKEGENASEKQIRRFRRETEAAAKLQHPNIVAVHEVGCHEGFHYFTMDLIEGDPLDAIIKRKEKMPVRKVLEAVKEVAQAIHYAHGKGIIHRDLKPANVLLDTDGHPKVTDFGLAKNIDHKSMLTRTGAVVGTPFYMPPEQARGDVDIDQRADVYALGVILYELLTLKLPFHGETTMEVYHKILEEEPIPPRRHDSRVDKDVNTIVLKAMEKEVTRRYQTAADLAEDIQRYLNGDPIKARPLGPIGRAIKKAKKNMPVVIVGTVTFLALVGSMALIYWRNSETERRQHEAKVEQEWENFQHDLGTQLSTANDHINQSEKLLQDKDHAGALAELQKAEQTLVDLDLLVEGRTRFNTEERLRDHLEEESPQIDSIYQEIYLYSGRAHAMKGNKPGYAKALECLKKGLERCDDPDADNALRLRLEIGRVQALQGNISEALGTFASNLKKSPKHLETRLEQGRAHELAGEHLKAIDCYTHVIERNDKNENRDVSVRAYLLRGQTYYALANYQSALQDFVHVTQLQEDSFEGHIWQGRTQQALANYGDANEALTNAIDITPSLPDGYYWRAELQFAQRKLPQAIKDYEVAISRSAQYYPANLGLGRALEWVLDYERAAQQYREILEADDAEAEKVRARAQTSLAMLNLVRSDLWECQLEVEEKYRHKHASSDGALGPPPPVAKLKQDSESLRRQRLAEAQSAFDKALEEDPNLVEALLGRAQLALIRKDTATALKHLNHSLEILTKRPSARHKGGSGSTAVSQEDDEDDWDEDEDEGWEDEEGGQVDTDALNADVTMARTRELLGMAALQAKKLPKARKQFRMALKANPNSAAAKAGLGHVAHLEGESDEAAKLFEDARKLQVKKSFEDGYFFTEGVRFEGLASRSKKPEFFKQARQAFARSSTYNHFHALSSLERAKLTASWASYDVAVALAVQAVKADPFLREGYERLGFLFTRDLPEKRNEKTQRPANLRDHARAEREFQKAIKVAKGSVETANAHYGRALALLAQAKADPAKVKQAKVDLQAAIKAIPKDFSTAEPRQINDSIAYLELSAKVNRQLGDEAAAKAALEQVGDVRKAAKVAADELLKQGRALRDRLNYSEAIKKFDRAIELDPKFDSAYYDRGTCYLKIGNFVPGILDFSRALELNPRIADQVYNKVYQISYVVDLNRVITELNKIVSDHPNVSYVVFLRGFFYVAKTEFKQVSREDLELGISDFDRCLVLNKTHVTALLYRGFLHSKMAEKETEPEKRRACYKRAMDNYKHALKLDPVSGISHYLQALCWSVQSTEEGISEDEAKIRRLKSIKELEASFGCEFKGYERIRNEKGFNPIRDMKEFKDLMRDK